MALCGYTTGAESTGPRIQALPYQCKEDPVARKDEAEKYREDSIKIMLA